MPHFPLAGRNSSGQFAPGHAPFRSGGRPPRNPRIAESTIALAEIETADRVRKPDPPAQLVARDFDGRFVKGHVAYRNGGRRRRNRELQQILRSKVNPEEVVQIVVNIMTDPNARHADRLLAATIISDFRDGKPIHSKH